MQGCTGWLDMYQDFCNPGILRHDSVRRGMRDSMTLSYPQVAVDNDVQIDEEFQSHLSDTALNRGE